MSKITLEELEGRRVKFIVATPVESNYKTTVAASLLAIRSNSHDINAHNFVNSNTWSFTFHEKVPKWYIVTYALTTLQDSEWPFSCAKPWINVPSEVKDE